MNKYKDNYFLNKIGDFNYELWSKTYAKRRVSKKN